ncbi:MAG: PDZ domain-containing protein [Planctomycetota bacterium]|nr:PDZ domain-containing protein [Planctomycetota bacterium]
MPATTGGIVLYENAALKRGDFYLVQPAVFHRALRPSEKALIYLSYSEGRSVFIEVDGPQWTLAREDGRGGVEVLAGARRVPGKTAAPGVGSGDGAAPADPGAAPETGTGAGAAPGAEAGAGGSTGGGGSAVPRTVEICAMKRGSSLAVLLDDEFLFRGDGLSDMAGPGGHRTLTPAVEFRTQSVARIGPVRFEDTFMRDRSEGIWVPLKGRWELSGMAFPDRSANPFSLFARFPGTPRSDPLDDGRIEEWETGIGIQIGGYLEEIPRVERITGGGPASRAGLQEDDMILEVDGVPTCRMNPWQVDSILRGGGKRGDEISLKVLRPGEAAPRTFVVRKGGFRWGTPREAYELPGGAPGPEALAVVGEPWWTGYLAEVSAKALGRGGFGLACAVRSASSFLLLRWLVDEASDGTADGTGAGGKASGRIELVRMNDGREKVLASKEGIGFRPFEFYRLALRWDASRIRAFVDGTPTFEVPVPEDIICGRVGLWARGGDGIYFDDVSVRSSGPDGGGDGVAGGGAVRTEIPVAAGRKDAGGSNAGAGPGPGMPGPARKAEVASGKSAGAYAAGLTGQESRAGAGRQWPAAAEPDMQNWANPAREWEMDYASGTAVYSFMLPGDQRIRLRHPRFESLDVILHTPDRKLDSGDVLSISRGEATIRSPWHEPVSMPLAEKPLEVEFLREGDRLMARIGGATLDAGPPKTPVPKPAGLAPERGRGPRAGIRGLKNLWDPATASIRASRVLDYSFDRAPADFLIQSGRWGILNKWICDPRWSWFGGRSDVLASAWTKHVFRGDISVDVYVAAMMFTQDPPYERPGDYNLAICGDGLDLSSGYALVFGGGGNRWTRLYRKGVPVAEATGEPFQPPSDRIRHPDKPELHQRWFHLRLEKIGNEIAFYADGREGIRWRDPDPLPGGRVGLWTVENGFLVARCRIAYQEASVGPLLPRRAWPFDDGVFLNEGRREVTTAVGRIRTPPELAKEFGGTAWRVENGIGGGTFSIQRVGVRVNPSEKSRLSFGYRFDPAAKVDMILFRNPWLGRIRLTGPIGSGWEAPSPAEDATGSKGTMPGSSAGGADTDPSEIAPVLAEIPDIRADGRWHRAELELYPHWVRYWEKLGRPPPRDFAAGWAFGNVSNADYLLAGFQGNPAGCSYSVSDVRWLAPKEYDSGPPVVSAVEFPFDEGGDGRSVKVRFDDGTGSGVAPETVEIRLDGETIRVPAAWDTTGGVRGVFFDHATQTLSVDLLARGRLLRDGEEVRLTILGACDRAGNPAKDLPKTFRWTARTAADRSGPAGVKVRIRLLVPARSTGRPGTVGDGAPAEEIGPPVALDFEDGIEGVSPKEGGGRPRADVPWFPSAGAFPGVLLSASRDVPPRGGGGSLRVLNLRDGSRFGFDIRHPPFDAAYWPLLEFDYKVPPETPMNLHFSHAGRSGAVMLTDIYDHLSYYSGDMDYVGRCEPFLDDGRWHSASIPLLEMLRSSRGDPGGWMVSGLSIYDHGWRGNRRGMEYRLDNIRLIPASRPDRIAFDWTASDLSGVTEYLACFDDRPDTIPKSQAIRAGEMVEAAARRAIVERGAGLPTEGRFAVRDGVYWLHLAAVDGAGNRSEVVHRKFIIDGTPPVIIGTDPPDGGRMAGGKVAIRIREAHAVDTRNIEVSAAGRTYRIGAPGLRYDAGRGVLEFDPGAAGQDIFAAGEPVRITVGGLADRLGNVSSTPYAFTVTCDPSLDRDPPVVKRLRRTISASPAAGPSFAVLLPRRMMAEMGFANGFESSLGAVRALHDARIERIEGDGAAFGRGCAEATVLAEGGEPRIELRSRHWDLIRRPIVSLACRMEPGVEADLAFELLGEKHWIRLNGNCAGNRPIASVEPPFVADGKWHYVAADVKSAVLRRRASLPAYFASSLTLAISTKVPPGKKLWLDDIEFAPRGWEGAWLEWEPPADGSGVSGYNIAMDGAPLTEVPAEIMVREPRLSIPPLRPAGNALFVHVRARDGAGNWGPTSHFALPWFGE